MFLNTLKNLGIMKQDTSSKSPAIVRNYLNKALNKAALIAIFGKKIDGAATIWEGASLFNGEPIKVVMSCYTKDSINDKTGPLVQLYILPADKSPSEAYFNENPLVCGDCKFLNNGCYVRWPNLRGIWSSAKQIHLSLEIAAWLCRGLRVRVGAAGDPAAVPSYVWQELLSHADSWTGYTHAWKYCDPSLRRYFMASCDTENETKQAIKQGWNVFFVHDGEITEDVNHIPCNADGVTKTCFSCMLCHGSSSNRQKSFVITEQLHGSTSTKAAARKAILSAKK